MNVAWPSKTPTSAKILNDNMYYLTDRLKRRICFVFVCVCVYLICSKTMCQTSRIHVVYWFGSILFVCMCTHVVYTRVYYVYAYRQNLIMYFDTHFNFDLSSLIFFPLMFIIMVYYNRKIVKIAIWIVRKEMGIYETSHRFSSFCGQNEWECVTQSFMFVCLLFPP